jgi:ribosomal-protein-alanine N-acetyltransferase
MPKTLIESLSFRLMTVDDLDVVQELDKQSFTNPWPEGAFKYELIESQNSRCWVAEMKQSQRSRVIGSAVLWIILDEAHIATLAVDPLYRGHGIGKRLLAVALIDAHNVGAKKAFLEARKNNQDALHLYFGFGFNAVGIRPGYYPDNHEDALLLSLDELDPSKLEKLIEA